VNDREADGRCGHCTPGFVLVMTQLLDEHTHPSDDQIKGV
jgi:aerobic-type carbon monoxide dehydrogenase small subunit (CoxS/CutS family)